MAELSVIIAQLRAMSTQRVNGIIRSELSKAARPLAPAVRAAILNTPSAGEKPWPPQVPGLRERIAGCVETWAKIEGDVVTVGVAVNSARMPDGQKSLPLMLDGEKRWRHPVYGNRQNWVSQPSHPYFWEAVAFWGPASQAAMGRATDEISRQLSG